MTPTRDTIATTLRATQASIIAALEELDGRGRFGTDAWERAGGGGGVTRVLAGGAHFEKAGVNFSEVHGEFPPEFAAKLPGSGTAFYATGVSLVLHPHSPHVPTVHANFRYIEQGERSWFGGGADLTPYYYDAADRDAFHRVWRELCERHGRDHARYRDWCDRYFFLPHRGERRGVGGIFFDDLAVGDAEFAFVAEGGAAFLDAYLPVARGHLATPVTEAQRRWQELRRGRYVEFNLLHDRGTIFGLQTNGRTESILMSLPPRVRWDYAFEPAAGSPEAELLAVLREPPP